MSLEKQKKAEMDLTSGNLFVKVLIFALPMAFTTILQLLYTTVDLYTVANFGEGANSMSAVGSNTALINLIITFFVSFSMGANVVMGNAKGANDKDRASKVLHTSMILALVTGIIVGAFGYFMTPLFLSWMSTPSDIIVKAEQYLKIYFLGLPFLMIYNYGSQILRALGDSKRPLYFLIISGLINVVFDLLFVIVFHLDVKGVAYATVLSEVVSAILVVVWLFVYKKGYVSLHIKELRIDKVSLISMVRIGFPSGLQGLGFCVPNVLIQASLYSINNLVIDSVSININEVVAGSSASSTVENYVYAFIEAFATACISFVSQNYGAKNKANIKKVLFYSIIWAEIFCLACSLICILLSDYILKVFITESEGVSVTNAIEAGRQRMILMVCTYGIDAIMDITSYYLRGMKHSTSPSIVTISCCVGLRCFFLYVLFPMEFFHTIIWLYMVYPITWTIASLILIPMTIKITNSEFKNMDDSKETIAA